MPKFIPLYKLSAEREARFWSHIDKSAGPDACWPWNASKDPSGYGKLKVAYGITLRAHRMAYFLSTGTDPRDLFVCHSCDNPVCCNPAHHFLGTASDNMQDAWAKGRKVAPPSKGEQNGNSKLTLAQVETICAMIGAGKNNKQIGRVFGVTHQTISRIRRGKIWGDTPLQQRYASLKRRAS